MLRAVLFIVVLLLAAFVPRDAQAACSGSSPNLTAPTWADVAACHSAASNGDTITVSAGSYTVTRTTTLTKVVRVIASGTVTLTNNRCASACESTSEAVVAITGSNRGYIQFGAVGNGFIINQGTATHFAPSGVIFVLGTGTYPALVFGNTYTGSGVMVAVSGPKAVLYGNTRTSAPSGGNCLNTDFFLHASWDGTGWSQVSKFGALDTDGTWKIYVDGNTVNYTSEAVSLNGSARAAIRKNTFRNSGVDHHGANTQTFGGRYSEVISNTFVWDGRSDWPGCRAGETQNLHTFFGAGAGTSRIIGNVIPDIPDTGWGDKNEILLLEERPFRSESGSVWRCWGTTSQPSRFTGFPIPFQNGWGYITGRTQAGNATLSGRPVMMDREPYYIVNNTGSSTNYANPTIQGYTNECGSTRVATDYLHSDEEYYKQIALGSFTGTTGASQGTRSQRPSSSTSGVAFWSTDAGGNWDTTNARADDGCLDIVVGGTWSNCVYTPCVYPHPAATGGSTCVAGEGGGGGGGDGAASRSRRIRASVDVIVAPVLAFVLVSGTRAVRRRNRYPLE